MGDTENALPPSKKRAAGREITKDNPGLDDEGDSSEETGTFKKASDEVLATRRIVKIRRNQSTTTSSNPFAGIRLVSPAEPSPAAAAAAATTEPVTTTEKAPEEKKTESGEEADKSKDETVKPAEAKTKEPVEADKSKDETVKPAEAKTKEPVAETEAEKVVSEDKQLNNVGSEAELPVAEKPEGDSKTENEKTVDSAVAENEKATENDKVETEAKKDNGSEEGDPNRLRSFQQLSSTQNAFTGLAGTGFSTATFSFGNKTEQPSFGFGLSTNGSSAIFNNTGPSIVSKTEGTVFPPKQEVPVETGEENEEAVFTADSVLFEYNNSAWKERGKGELKVNVSTSGPQRARLLMRSRGNYRLILNASLYPDMKLANMDKRGITFACINSVGETTEGLSTFALKFKDSAIVDEFKAAVTAHKDKTGTTRALKTPENSPKAAEE